MSARVLFGDAAGDRTAAKVTIRAFDENGRIIDAIDLTGHVGLAEPMKVTLGGDIVMPLRADTLTSRSELLP